MTHHTGNEEERESIILKNHGQKLFCIFHKPAHRKNCPAVLLCHGLGGHKVGRYRLYVSLAKHLAEWESPHCASISEGQVIATANSMI